MTFEVTDIALSDLFYYRHRHAETHPDRPSYFVYAHVEIDANGNRTVEPIDLSQSDFYYVDWLELNFGAQSLVYGYCSLCGHEGAPRLQGNAWAIHQACWESMFPKRRDGYWNSYRVPSQEDALKCLKCVDRWEMRQYELVTEMLCVQAWQKKFDHSNNGRYQAARRQTQVDLTEWDINNDAIGIEYIENTHEILGKNWRGSDSVCEDEETEIRAMCEYYGWEPDADIVSEKTDGYTQEDKAFLAWLHPNIYDFVDGDWFEGQHIEEIFEW